MQKINLISSARNLSPLSLLVLAACGGSSTSGGGSGSTSSSSSASAVSGSVIKGPLTNALVGLDYDGDGIVDSATVRTGADGSFSISTTSTTYTIIAVTDGKTIDTSSGTVLSGVTLKAPKGAGVITPATTLMLEGNLTADQVATVLGLPDGVDPLTFNPFAAGVSTADALAVEKASQQIMSVVKAFSGSAEGAGASEVDAFSAALKSVVEVVKTKAAKLTDPNASAADKSLDLTDTVDLALIKTQAKTEILTTTGVNTTAFDAIADDIAAAVENVNAKIEAVTDLRSDASKNAFSSVQVLADQVKTAATAEASSAGTGNITFKDANVVNTAASNAAPTNIALSSNSISEAAGSLVIGTLSTVDSDQDSGVAFTYAIAEVAGTDHSAFSINQATGELSLEAQPDYETKTSYSVTVLSTDDGGKTFSKSFTVAISDTNDAPTVANAIADQTATEDSAFSVQFDADVFADVDEGDSFTYTATLSDGSALPSWLSFNADTRTFSGTPLNANVGVLAVKVIATDSSSATVSDTFNITVGNTNDAPTVANAIADQTIAEDSALSFQFSSEVFSDVDEGDSFTYTATLSDGSALPSWLSFDADTRTFSGTPLNANVGVLAVKVIATDGSSSAITDTFNLTVTNTNDASIITGDTVGVLTASTDEAFGVTATGSLTINDVDTSDTPSFVAQDSSLSIASMGLVTLATDGGWTYAAANDSATIRELNAGETATDSFTATASDGTSEVVTITITGVNEDPTGVIGGSNSDTIIGDDYANYLYGGAGAGVKDTLTGNGGADIFISCIADATIFLSFADIITDFVNGTDKIGLEDRSFSDLNFSNENGGTKIVDTSSSKILFWLDGIDSALIDSDDFISTDFV